MVSEEAAGEADIGEGQIGVLSSFTGGNLVVEKCFDMSGWAAPQKRNVGRTTLVSRE